MWSWEERETDLGKDTWEVVFEPRLGRKMGRISASGLGLSRQRKQPVPLGLVCGQGLNWAVQVRLLAPLVSQ